MPAAAVHPKLRLDEIAIASPCTVAWSSMRGDDKVRHCGQCRKSVYNLSAMTRAEAEALIACDEPPCVRFFRRADGTIMTSDCQSAAVRFAAKVVRFLFAALAACCALVGCVELSFRLMEPQLFFTPQSLVVQLFNAWTHPVAMGMLGGADSNTQRAPKVKTRVKKLSNFGNYEAPRAE